MKPLILFIATSALGLAVAPGFAADYDPPLYDPPVYVEDAEVPVEVGSGWYLRGDVGYALSTKAAGPFTFRTFDPGTGTYSNNAFETASLKSGLMFGGGFGYRFTDWVRADLTAERFSTRFSGTTFGATPCDAVLQPADSGCRSNDSSSLTATSIMANGYIDLGTIAGFTPYVGAGAGITIGRWGSLDSTYNCVPGATPCAVVPAPTSSRDGLSSVRFTYAAMAGVAYDVSQNLKVDLGYKYRRVAGSRMFGFSDGEQAVGATGTQGTAPAFGQHEIRVGLRYELW